jgi:hypothetical protein
MSITDSEMDDSISINTEECDLCDEIEEYDDEYIECVNNNYYIGSYYIMKNIEDNDTLLFGIKINIPTFYAFSNYALSTYIYFCSGFQYEYRPTIEIMQLKIEKDGMYTAIIKTFWIKLIQRKWKKIFAQRKQYEKNIKKNILKILNPFQITNRIPKPPGLHGMLYNL